MLRVSCCVVCDPVLYLVQVIGLRTVPLSYMPTTCDYYRDADILEVFFADEGATAAVSVTPDITLHFRPEDGAAVSLVFNNFARLVEPDQYGRRTFNIEASHWPEPWRAVVWRLLSSFPVNEWLETITYHPRRQQRAIPLATVKSFGALAQPA